MAAAQPRHASTTPTLTPTTAAAPNPVAAASAMLLPHVPAAAHWGVGVALLLEAAAVAGAPHTPPQEDPGGAAARSMKPPPLLLLLLRAAHDAPPSSVEYSPRMPPMGARALPLALTSAPLLPYHDTPSA